MSNGQLQELLQKHVIFSLLDDNERSTLIQQMEKVSFAMGETIVQEGEMGDCAYLLSAGKARVFRQGATGKPVTLGILSRGDLFGERSIITREPRIASIRASEDVEAFRIRHEDFEKLLANNAELRPYFDKLLQEIAIVNFLRLKTFVGDLPPKQILSLLDKFEEVTFHKDETIVTEGVSNQRLYIIREGEVKVVKRLDGVETILAYVREGDYFGERSMLRDDLPIATVIATQETTCLALAYAHLKRILDSSPSLQEQFARRIEHYSDEAFQLPAPEPFSSPSLPVTTAHAEATKPDISQPQQRRRWLRRYPWIRQHDENDCGAACLAMISRAYGVRLSVGRARDLIRVGREGVSMYNIAAGAETLGFMSRAVNADYASAATLELPAIAHWQGYHYIVLYEIKPAHVIVGDPAIGILRLSRQDFEAGWTGRLLLLTPTSTLEDVEPEKNPLKRFLPLLRPYKFLLLEVLLASLLLELFTLAIPIFTQTIVDKVLVHNNIPMLNIMLGGMVIVGIFRAITGVLRQYLLIHVSTKLGLRMAADLFQQIMRLPLGYFRTRKIGDLLTRFSDNAKVRQLITGASITTMLDALMIGVYIGLMLYYNVKLALLVALFLPLFAIVMLLFTPALKRSNQQIFTKQALAQSNLVESIEAIDTIKSSTAELPSRWHFENLIVQQANVVFHSATLFMGMTSLTSTLQMFATIVLLWYGAHLVLQGDLTVGQLVAFHSLLGMMLTPIIGIVGLWQTLQDAFLSLERLNDIYDAEVEETSAALPIHLPPVRGRVTFDHVSFRYNPDDKNILANITFDILPGQTCAIVGRSGSGKTTLISLLQRFYAPTEGRILVDGYDLTSISLQSLRAQIGVVLQESKLFTGTIRENISTSEPEASLERVIHAAKLANAHDFIMAFPLGYSTMVGEVGVKLSGGQKQRICIARALLQEPRIIVFDEATSSLDSESERAIQENMQNILKERTAFIIAHRLSTVRHADVILVLDDGVIVERGNHQELMELRGLYYYLNSQQLST